MSVQLAVKSLLTHLDRLNAALSEELKAKLGRQTSELEERLQFLLSGAEHGLLHRNLFNRLQAQQAVVRIVSSRILGWLTFLSYKVVQPHRPRRHKTQYRSFERFQRAGGSK